MSLKADIQGFDISKNSALIVGCGGLGTNVAVHLAGAGIGRLRLVDYDTVEERNLNRQFFYTKDDIGKPKSSLLSERLSAYAPEVKIDCRTERFDGSMAEGFELIVIAVDNIKTRKEVNAFCRKSGKPCVNGSINGFFGTAYLFIPGKTSDLEAAGCLVEPTKKPSSPSSTAALIGAAEAKLATDYFLNDYQSAGTLYIYDNNEIHSLIIKEGSI